MWSSVSRPSSRTQSDSCWRSGATERATTLQPMALRDGAGALDAGPAAVGRRVGAWRRRNRHACGIHERQRGQPRRARRGGAGSRGILGGALRRLRDPILLAVVPVTFALLLAFVGYANSWIIGFDFRGTLWEPARSLATARRSTRCQSARRSRSATRLCTRPSSSSRPCRSPSCPRLPPRGSGSSSSLW